MALHRFWPAVFWGTMAFSALYHLMGAFIRWPAVVALLYSFFIETLLGNMPGYLKRASIGFYMRCMMFDAAKDFGVEPEKPSVYLAVDGTTACWILFGATVVLLGVGMALFSRTEYVAAD
jgi:ABC-2 type transport system permease protein